MKKVYLIFTLLASALYIQAQTDGILRISGDAVFVPEYGMKGIGYTLSFQQEIKNNLAIECGLSYAQAYDLFERDEIIDQVQLMDLARQHLSYGLYLAPVYKINAGQKLNIELFAGAVTRYQSVVLGITHYTIIEEVNYRNYINDPRQEIYKNEVHEGAYVGGIAGCRIALELGNNWELMTGVNMNAMLHSSIMVNGNLALGYKF